MGNLTDAIERYLCQLLAERETLEVQRRALALLFRCAPSQINYVLETRFTPARGYLVESRRGGGGYIRITRIKDEGLTVVLRDRLDAHEVPGLLARLETEGWLSRSEVLVLRKFLGEVLAEEDFDPSVARARMLRTVLVLLGRRKKERG
ncbi:MAG: CtsR family transcriptional regulator [Firmicutes bacterium]|nr:CtsR family transcriptional regulator [Bacillota bacterium]